MNVRTYKIFISHAWEYYSDQYKDLISLLNSSPCFHYCNYSSPQDKPLIKPSIYAYPWLFLKQKIKHRIKCVDTVLVIAGPYDIKYCDWIQIEMEITQKYNKPIIAICPLGQECIPHEIRVVATAVVSWNPLSIINTIRSHANLT
jgi:hypothetical protein